MVVVFLGRTHHGAYDGWYGPKGRKREYDLDAVKESVVARVIHNIPDPVSYTHLDVYKRQLLNLPSSSPHTWVSHTPLF